VASRLVADIGGTNTRIALFDDAMGEFRALREYLNRDFNNLDHAIASWLDTLDEAAPESACIAAAAYQSGDFLRMVNCPWAFSCSDLALRFGWQAAGWLNDFEANAHALPYLDAQQHSVLHAGVPGASGKLAVVGPGTGFGGATLVRVGEQFAACAAEPGHMGLSPANEVELAVFQHLLREQRDIFVEFLVSGPGLVRLYGALAELGGTHPAPLQPQEVAERALRGSDPLCAQALELFCALYGSACGDFILANGAWQGLFLAGGISGKILEFLKNSSFLSRLQEKGAMTEHLSAVPVSLITASQPGLIGAAHAPLQPL